MFTVHKSRDSFQSAVCLLLATVIVAASLAFGALGVESLTSSRPVVTITQLA